MPRTRRPEHPTWLLLRTIAPCRHRSERRVSVRLSGESSALVGSHATRLQSGDWRGSLHDYASPRCARSPAFAANRAAAAHDELQEEPRPEVGALGVTGGWHAEAQEGNVSGRFSRTRPRRAWTGCSLGRPTATRPRRQGAPRDGYFSVASSSAPASSSRWGRPATCLPRFFGLKSPETPSPTAPADPAIAPPTPFAAVSARGASGTPSPSRSTLRNGRGL
jgi:hypothetical protein